MELSRSCTGRTTVGSGGGGCATEDPLTVRKAALACLCKICESAWLRSESGPETVVRNALLQPGNIRRRSCGGHLRGRKELPPGLTVVTAGDKAEVAGHQPGPFCTIRFRQSLAFAFEMVHARYAQQVARACEAWCWWVMLPIGDQESELSRRNSCIGSISSQPCCCPFAKTTSEPKPRWNYRYPVPLESEVCERGRRGALRTSDSGRWTGI